MMMNRRRMLRVADDVMRRRFELSVIVPARNEERNLAECLASLLAQDDGTFSAGAGLGADRGR